MVRSGVERKEKRAKKKDSINYAEMNSHFWRKGDGIIVNIPPSRL